MSKLRDLLKTQVCLEATDEKYRDIVIDRLEEEIRQEIIQEEAIRIAETEETEHLLKNAEQIKEAFWTIVIIGILVGVTANQITELATSIKTSMIHTAILAVVLLAVMYALFWANYIRKAYENIREFKEKR